MAVKGLRLTIAKFLVVDLQESLLWGNFVQSTATNAIKAGAFAYRNRKECPTTVQTSPHPLLPPTRNANCVRVCILVWDNEEPEITLYNQLFYTDE